jgi:hypothetical protein
MRAKACSESSAGGALIAGVDAVGACGRLHAAEAERATANDAALTRSSRTAFTTARYRGVGRSDTRATVRRR